MLHNGARVQCIRALIVFGITVTVFAAGTKRRITGVITDSECATADHSVMHMGSTDAECVKACVEAHGATYVLYDGKVGWNLSDQKLPEKFAGKKVAVTGTVDEKTKTINVESIR